MSSDTEHQQVAIALMEESEKPSSEKVKQVSKKRRPRKNYCTEDYLVGYGIPILIVILVIVGLILTFIVLRKYNQDCKNTKEASCRGIRWLFT
jgi:uncharacterized protein YneF (UPF0154 family)